MFLFIIEKQLPLTHLYSYYCQSTLSAPKLVTYQTTARQSWFLLEYNACRYDREQNTA